MLELIMEDFTDTSEEAREDDEDQEGIVDRIKQWVS